MFCRSSIWITLFSNDDRQLICSASPLFEKQNIDTGFLASLRPLNMERKEKKIADTNVLSSLKCLLFNNNANLYQKIPVQSGNIKYLLQVVRPNPASQNQLQIPILNATHKALVTLVLIIRFKDQVFMENITTLKILFKNLKRLRIWVV